MTRVELAFDLHVIAEKGFVDRDDVDRLRNGVFHQGVVSPDEAKALFWLNECVASGVPEWPAYFAEALSDHFVHHQWPQDYMDDAGADRLASVILRDGRIASANELELLVRVIEQSVSTPDSLVLFALGEVRAAVFTGHGPTRDESAPAPGTITDAEVAVAERVIHALARQGCPSVSRAGAEILFDLNRQLSAASDISGWSRVFVNAMASYVLAGRSPQPQAATAVSANCRTSQAESAWLVSRIGHDGALLTNERELLNYIGSQADQIHPELEALIARAA